MNWETIEKFLPSDAEEEFLVWCDGCRYPTIASFDHETQDFFETESSMTLSRPKYWMPLPELPKG